jgi:thiol-disulfide isomerase/thioredoxin
VKTFVPRPLLLALTLALIVCAIAYVELRFDRADPGAGRAEAVPPSATQPEEVTAEATEPRQGTSEPPEQTEREDAEERVARKEAEFTRAAEIVAPTRFINTDGVTIGENVGKKVVLIEFWTYSCYNCQNAQPYISQWHETYEDEGLLVIGVHRPEFEFEKDPASVEAAVREAGIEYPVVLDNDAATWDAYDNRYWPAWYLIDADGFVRYRHFGEGAYEETEAKIQALLAERDEISGS